MSGRYRRRVFPAIFGFTSFVFIVLWAYAHGTTVDATAGVNADVHGYLTDVHSEHGFDVESNHSVSGTLYIKHWVPQYVNKTYSSNISQEDGLSFYDFTLNSWNATIPAGSYTAKADSDATIDGDPGYALATDPFTVP